MGRALAECEHGIHTRGLSERGLLEEENFGEDWGRAHTHRSGLCISQLVSNSDFKLFLNCVLSLILSLSQAGKTQERAGLGLSRSYYSLYYYTVGFHLDVLT